MVSKSLQVEELRIRVGTWKQEVLIWINYEKSSMKSFLSYENKVKQKNKYEPWAKFLKKLRKSNTK